MSDANRTKKLAEYDASWDAGSGFACGLMPTIKRTLEDCREPAAFWSGLIAALSGGMVASIGVEDTRKVLELAAGQDLTDVEDTL
jgi:hypothetical protein